MLLTASIGDVDKILGLVSSFGLGIVSLLVAVRFFWKYAKKLEEMEAGPVELEHRFPQLYIYIRMDEKPVEREMTASRCTFRAICQNVQVVFEKDKILNYEVAELAISRKKIVDRSAMFCLKKIHDHVMPIMAIVALAGCLIVSSIGKSWIQQIQNSLYFSVFSLILAVWIGFQGSYVTSQVSRLDKVEKRLKEAECAEVSAQEIK